MNMVQSLLQQWTFMPEGPVAPLAHRAAQQMVLVDLIDYDRMYLWKIVVALSQGIQ